MTVTETIDIFKKICMIKMMKEMMMMMKEMMMKDMVMKEMMMKEVMIKEMMMKEVMMKGVMMKEVTIALANFSSIACLARAFFLRTWLFTL